MATKITTWIPDTCISPGCAVQYTWDDTVQESQRIHTYLQTLQKCSAHTSLIDISLYNTILSENQNKNIAYGLVISNFPQYLVNGELGPNNQFSWSYDQNRKLQVSINNMTQQDMTTYQNLCNTQFGNGVVTVVVSISVSPGPGQV